MIATNQERTLVSTYGFIVSIHTLMQVVANYKRVQVTQRNWIIFMDNSGKYEYLSLEGRMIWRSRLGKQLGLQHDDQV